MRRTDTASIGAQAEHLAARLLEDRGFSVTNLKELRGNCPLYDLAAKRGEREILISVKRDRANCELRLGPPHRVRRLEANAVLVAFLPISKGRDVELAQGGYEL